MTTTTADERLAVALLRRSEAVLQLPYSDPNVIRRPLFDGGRPMLASRPIDSLDLIEVMVAIDDDLGVLVLDRVELRGAGTLAGLAELIRARADPLAVERFCAQWAEVGLYRV